MHNRKWWFKIILVVVLGLLVTTGTIPTFIQPVQAQGVFGNKRQGSQSDEDKQKQEQERQERERAAQEAREREEREKQAKEQAERQAKERAEQESREKAQREQEQAERQRREQEQAERDRQAKEQAEKQRQAQETAERERQEKERTAQEERDRQAKEQADREAQDRARREQAEKDRQQKEQEERDRVTREQTEREKQQKEQQERQAQQERNRNPVVHQPVQTNTTTNTNTNSSRIEDNNKVNKPVANDPDRKGGKFTRVEEKPKLEREDDHESHRYHPHDYYPYDPGYRNYPDDRHIPIPQPLPLPNPPDDDNPDVIVIERGPSSRPEPEPPTDSSVEPVEETAEQAPEDATVTDTEPVTGEPKELQGEENAVKELGAPVIPEELKIPAKPGSPEEALNNICLAWLIRDDAIVKRFVDLNTPIRIYNRGKFSHKMTAKEFLEITSQALKQTDTREFSLKRLSYKHGKIFAGGNHSYIGLDGELHNTALNYTLKKINDKWTIVEVGFTPKETPNPAPQPEG